MPNRKAMWLDLKSTTLTWIPKQDAVIRSLYVKKKTVISSGERINSTAKWLKEENIFKSKDAALQGAFLFLKTQEYPDGLDGIILKDVVMVNL